MSKSKSEPHNNEHTVKEGRLKSLSKVKREELLDLLSDIIVLSFLKRKALNKVEKSNKP